MTSGNDEAGRRGRPSLWSCGSLPSIPDSFNHRKDLSSSSLKPGVPRKSKVSQLRSNFLAKSCSNVNEVLPGAHFTNSPEKNPDHLESNRVVSRLVQNYECGYTDSKQHVVFDKPHPSHDKGSVVPSSSSEVTSRERPPSSTDKNFSDDDSDVELLFYGVCPEDSRLNPTNPSRHSVRTIFHSISIDERATHPKINRGLSQNSLDLPLYVDTATAAVNQHPSNVKGLSSGIDYSPSLQYNGHFPRTNPDSTKHHNNGHRCKMDKIPSMPTRSRAPGVRAERTRGVTGVCNKYNVSPQNNDKSPQTNEQLLHLSQRPHINLECVDFEGGLEVHHDNMSSRLSGLSGFASRYKQQSEEVKPSFIVRPRRQFVEDGAVARFKASCDGQPTPSVRWQRNHQEIVNSQKYKIYEKASFHFFEVHDVCKSDGGTYTCVITNSLGTEQTSADLEIFSKPRPRSHPERIAPKFETSLNDITVTEGATAVLECTVSGNPKPFVQWNYDGKILRRSSEIEENMEGSTASLTFSNITGSQAGTYECVASNAVNVARTSCTLTVGDHVNQHNPYMYNGTSDRTSMYRHGNPPSFVQELRDVQVNNETVELVAMVTGDSPIAISWFHDNQKISPDNRYYDMVSLGNTHKLVVYDPSLRNAGKYVCQAANNHGETATSCVLSVTGPSFQPGQRTGDKISPVWSQDRPEISDSFRRPSRSISGEVSAPRLDSHWSHPSWSRSGAEDAVTMSGDHSNHGNQGGAAADVDDGGKSPKFVSSVSFNTTGSSTINFEVPILHMDQNSNLKYEVTDSNISVSMIGQNDEVGPSSPRPQPYQVAVAQNTPREPITISETKGGRVTETRTRFTGQDPPMGRQHQQHTEVKHWNTKPSGVNEARRKFTGAKSSGSLDLTGQDNDPSKSSVRKWNTGKTSVSEARKMFGDQSVSVNTGYDPRANKQPITSREVKTNVVSDVRKRFSGEPQNKEQTSTTQPVTSQETKTGPRRKTYSQSISFTLTHEKDDLDVINLPVKPEHSQPPASESWIQYNEPITAKVFTGPDDRYPVEQSQPVVSKVFPDTKNMASGDAQVVEHRKQFTIPSLPKSAPPKHRPSSGSVTETVETFSDIVPPGTNTYNIVIDTSGSAARTIQVTSDVCTPPGDTSRQISDVSRSISDTFKQMVNTKRTDSARQSVDTSRPTVDISRPSVDISRPAVDISRPAVGISRPTVDISRPTVDISRPTVDISRPTVDISRPTVDISRPTVDISRPTVDTSKPAVDISRPTVDISRPTVDISKPAVDISRPTVDISRPTVDISRPTADTARPSVDISRPTADSDMVKLSEDKSRSSLDTSHPTSDVSKSANTNVQSRPVSERYQPSKDQSKRTGDTSQPAPDTSKIPVDTSLSEHTSSKGGVTQPTTTAAPLFSKRPKSTTVEEGSSAKFTAEVKGQPTPEVTWLKDNKALSKSDRYKFSSEKNRSTLEIVETTAQDSARYVCQISNSAGTDKCSINLTVKTKEVAESTDFRNVLKSRQKKFGVETDFGKPKTSPSAGKTQHDFRGVLKRKVTTNEKPKFLRFLENKEVIEGHKVTFEVKVMGTPLPKVTWYNHDRREIQECSSFHVLFSTTEHVAKLVISEARTEDSGPYYCRAENEGGYVESSCRLVVREQRSRESSTAGSVVHSAHQSETSSESHDQTELLEQLQELTTEHSTDVSHDSGVPSGDEILNYDSDAQHDLQSECKISADRHASLGSEFSNDRHTSVDSEVSIDQKPPTEPQISEELEAPADLQMPPDLSHDHYTSHDPRKSKQKFSFDTDLEASVDADIKDVARSPSPQAPSDPEEIVTQKPQESVEASILEKYPSEDIKSPRVLTRQEEVHMYDTTEPERPLTERVTQKPSHKQTAEEPPMIVNLLPQRLSILKGNKISLHGTFVGRPAPRVRWYIEECRARTELLSDDHMTIEITDGATSLTIAESQERDTGIYTLEISNSLGLNQLSSSVTVEDTPDPPVSRPFTSNIRNHSLALSWYGSGYDGGSPVLHYRVEMKREKDSDWLVLTDTCQHTSYNVEDLQANEGYEFRICAGNCHGFGDPSKPSDIVYTMEKQTKEQEEEEETAEPANVEIVVPDSGSCVKRMSSQHPPRLFFSESVDLYVPTPLLLTSPLSPDAFKAARDELPFEPRVVDYKTDTKFEDAYSLGEQIGRGKFGHVYRCTDRTSGRTYAAKFIKTTRVSQKTDVKQEVRVMNQLHHPKLLLLWDAFEAKREIVLVMEHIRGGELLNRVVDEDYILTERECVHFMRQICDGIKYMHKNNIVHLDLKPENVMCITSNSNEVKIIDFGLARELDLSKDNKVMFGTAEFVAPEIVNYDAIGHATDMWSVGVVCYILLSGLSPFAGDNDSQTFSNVVIANYDFESDEFDAISDDAKDFIEKLLCKSLKERMTAGDCLMHNWLSQDVKYMRAERLSTEKHKRFLNRMKWRKAKNAVEVINRMQKTLSRTSLFSSKSASQDSSPSMESFSESFDQSSSSSVDKPTNRSTASVDESSNGSTTPVDKPTNGSAVISSGSSDSMDDTLGFRRSRNRSWNGINISTSRVKSRSSTQELDINHNGSFSPTSVFSDAPIRRSSPVFQTKMRDFEVFEGENAKFEVCVEGTSNVTWYKDGLIILECADKYVFNNNVELGKYALVIKDCDTSDNCQYECKAQNSNGEARCQASLHVEGGGD